MTHRYSLLHKPSRNIEDDQDLQQIHKQHQRNFKDLQGVSELLFMASVQCTILDFIFSTHVVGIVWSGENGSLVLNWICHVQNLNRTELEHSDNDFPSQGRTSILRFQIFHHMFSAARLKGWRDKNSPTIMESHITKNMHMVGQSVCTTPATFFFGHLLHNMCGTNGLHLVWSHLCFTLVWMSWL